MTTRHTGARLLALLIALVLIAAACGSDSDSASEETTEETTSNTRATPRPSWERPTSSRWLHLFEALDGSRMRLFGNSNTVVRN